MTDFSNFDEASQDPIAVDDIDLSDLEDPDAYRETDLGQAGFDAAMQQAIVSAVVSNASMCKIVADTVSPAAFDSKTHRTIVSVACDHFAKYGTLPSLDTALFEIRVRHGKDKALLAFLGEAHAVYEFPSMRFDTGYLIDRIKQFARYALSRKAIKTYTDSAEKGEPDFTPLRELICKVDALDSGNVGRRGYFPGELTDLPPTSWAIEKHSIEGGFEVLYGRYGVTKTFYALDMALSRSTGLPFLGKYQSKQTKVVYVTGEGQSGIRKRMWAWCRERGLSLEDLKDFLLIPFSFDMTNPSEAETLIQMVKEAFGEMPGMVVFDTLSRMFGAGDQNSSQDMTKFVGNLTKIQEAGRMEGKEVTVLTLAHTGKDASRGIMGSMVLPGACDTILKLEKAGDLSVRVSWDKTKDSGAEFSYLFSGRVVDLPDDIDPSGSGTLVLTTDSPGYSAPKLSDGQAKFIVALWEKHSHEDFTWGAAKSATGTPGSSCTRHLEDLIKSGYLTKDRGRYQIPKSAEPSIRILARASLATEEDAVDSIVKAYQPTDDADC